MDNVLHRMVVTLRRSWEGQRELDERRSLVERPWEEEYLHWSFDGEHWVLHGTLMPPNGRRRSVTSTGWCPGLARAAR